MGSFRGVVPPSSGDVTISHDVTVDASTNTLGALTVDASKTLTVATGQTITRLVELQI